MIKLRRPSNVSIILLTCSIITSQLSTTIIFADNQNMERSVMNAVCNIVSLVSILLSKGPDKIPYMNPTTLKECLHNTSCLCPITDPFTTPNQMYMPSGTMEEHSNIPELSVVSNQPGTVQQLPAHFELASDTQFIDQNRLQAK
jgi:hypothetical protein